MILVIAILTALSLPLQAKPLKINFSGKALKSLSEKNLTTQYKPKVLKVWEPHENKPVEYKVIPLKNLLDSVTQKKWRTKEVAIFRCDDGYEAVVDVQRLLLEKPYLAYGRVDGEFKVNNRFQKEKNVPLGPYYLVWDNMKSPKEKREVAEGWPYQVVALDFADFIDRYPKLAPPKNISPVVNEGFQDFRTYCLSCHSVNGEGGKKGPELNYPVSVTEYFNPNWLEKWILDPQSIRWGTTMPALAASENRKEIAGRIRAYLGAMAKFKKKPK